MKGSALRTGVLVVGALLTIGGAVATAATCSGAPVSALILGLVLLVGIAIERWRYKPLAEQPPGPDWIATEERFIDPGSGRPVQVYQHPRTGERRYVAVG